MIIDEPSSSKMRTVAIAAGFQPMVPIRIIDGTRLDGVWSGPRLDMVRVLRGTVEKQSFLLQIGYGLPRNAERSEAFKPLFGVHYPVEGDREAPEVRAEALRCAEAFMQMLNLRRI